MLPLLFSRILRIVGEVSIASKSSFTISNDATSQSEILLDFGRAGCSGGIPYFNITRTSSSISSEVAFEVVHSESIHEVDYWNGDGPFYLFSNAMDTYRNISHAVHTSAVPQVLNGRLLQASQRYLRLRLTSPDSTITFSEVGFTPVRAAAKPLATFSSSNRRWNEIWEQGVRTVDACTVYAGEIIPAWEIHDGGTRVHGQHWAPCRFGTRWIDYTTYFSVRAEVGGASWGVRMVANGLLFLLDTVKREVRAFEGLSDASSAFSSTARGVWPIPDGVDLEDWIDITIRASGSTVSVFFNESEPAIAEVQNVEIVPLLGGAPNNSGSVAFGGPSGWRFNVRSLTVTSLTGEELYSNTMLPKDSARILADFAVGTNPVANTIDGAKRDRAIFGGDLHIIGRSIAYSTQYFEAVQGSIELLTSHQTNEGYLGNLAPIQAPVWNQEKDGETATYAFYSLTYASLLIVAIKDYIMHSGALIDDTILAKLRKQLHFTESYTNSDGLIEAPPEISMVFVPAGGPVIGVSTGINLAYYDALKSMAFLTPNVTEAAQLTSRAATLERRIVAHLWNPATGTLRLGQSLPSGGYAQSDNGYGISLGILPAHEKGLSRLEAGDTLPSAFQNLTGWADLALCSPYATAFAVEALFSMDAGSEALVLLEQVWGVMADTENPNYSGGHWEAMTLDGKPYHNSTSLMHGWSTGPVYLLPMYLTGLRPTTPGWKTWEARPVWAGIQEVSTSIPTPNGVVEIMWNFNDGKGTGSVQWSVPEASSGIVYPPSGWHIAQSDYGIWFGEAGVTCGGGKGRYRRSLRRIV